MENPPAPETLITESDVEQKFTWPLLTGLSPHGLGLTAAELFTKPDIRAFEIEKGQAAKRRYLDTIQNATGVRVEFLSHHSFSPTPIRFQHILQRIENYQAGLTNAGRSRP